MRELQRLAFFLFSETRKILPHFTLLSHFFECSIQKLSLEEVDYRSGVLLAEWTASVINLTSDQQLV